MSKIPDGAVTADDMDTLSEVAQKVCVAGTSIHHGTVCIPVYLCRDPNLSATTKGLYLSLAAQPEGKEIDIGKFDKASRRERIAALFALFQHGYAAVFAENGGAMLFVRLYDASEYAQTRKNLYGETIKPEDPKPKPPKIKRYVAEEHKPVNVTDEAWSGWIAMRRGRRFPVNEKYIHVQIKRIESWEPAVAEEALRHCTVQAYQGLFQPHNATRTAIVADNRQILLKTKQETREDELP